MNENQLKLLEEFIPFFLEELGSFISFDTSFPNGDMESRNFGFMIPEEDVGKLNIVEIEKNVYEIKMSLLSFKSSHRYLTSDDYEGKSSSKYITNCRFIFSSSQFKEYQDAEEDNSLLQWTRIFVAKYSSFSIY